MFVIKRKGFRQEVNFDKIHARIKYLVHEPIELIHVNASQLTQRVIQSAVKTVIDNDGVELFETIK